MSTDVDAPTDIAGAGEGGGEPEHLDVVVVGAGLSGVGTACHLEREHPQRRYAILEAREDLGGHVEPVPLPRDPLGLRHAHPRLYRFKPWTESTGAIADGPAILDYVRETAEEFGVDAHIRYGHRVAGAEWSSERLSGGRVDARPRRPGEKHADLLLPALVLRLLPLRRRATPRSCPGIEHFGGNRLPTPSSGTPSSTTRASGSSSSESGATAVTLVPSMLQGAGRRPRHDAAALAELRALHRADRPRGRGACRGGSRGPSPTR